MAIRAKELDQRKERATRKARREGREAPARVFEELTSEEKDLLLKELAVRLGLIQDSEDSE